MYSKTKITNCTFVRNEAPIGGGIYSTSSAHPYVYNSVIKGNPGGSFGGPGLRTVRYSNIGGGHVGLGNINVNPLFVDYPNGDLRLLPGSPCIDAGRNAYVPESVVIDLAGLPRFLDDPATPDSGQGSPAIVDMGAYEFQPD
jgi:hypothetical protein